MQQLFQHVETVGTFCPYHNPSWPNDVEGVVAMLWTGRSSIFLAVRNSQVSDDFFINLTGSEEIKGSIILS